MLLLCLVAVLSVCSAHDILYEFIRSYASEELFWAPMYNAIDCPEQGDIKWTRSISAATHGLLAVHKSSESLESWVNQDETQLFFLNVNCPGAESILKQANASQLFRHPFQWLLVDTSAFWESSESINSSDSDFESKWYWQTLKELNILIDSEVRATTPGENGTVLIIAAYKIWTEGDLLSEEIAEWNPDTGLTLRTREPRCARRWDVRGVRFPGTLAVTQKDTLNHLEDMVDKHIDPVMKVTYVLIKHFAEMINASLDINIVYTWGVNVNGTWTGLVGDLQSGRSEIGISPVFVLAERMNIIKYFEVLTPTKSKFIFLSPPLSFSNNIFTMPFDKMVWISSLAMVIISCFMLYVATKMEKENVEMVEVDAAGNIVRLEDFSRTDALKDSFSDVLLLNIGAICNQGAAVEPKGPSGRIIAIFLYFAYMFLYVSYSGSIVALLQSSDTSIKTFKDLLESPLQVGADDVIYSQYYFKTEQEPIRRALFEKKIAPKNEKPHFLSPEEGVKNVRKGLYAYHVETSVGYTLIQRTFTEEEKCGLQEFKLSFYQNIDPHIAMRIHSPFAEHMRVGLKRIIERGLNHRIMSRIYVKKPTCSSKGSRFVSVGLLDCYHAFMIVVYGIVLAWMMLFIELFAKTRVQKVKRRWQMRRTNSPRANAYD